MEPNRATHLKCNYQKCIGFDICKFKWDKVFKKGPSKICGRQPLKNFAWSIVEYFVPSVKYSGFITFDTFYYALLVTLQKCSLTCLKIGLQNKSESRILETSKMESFATAFKSCQVLFIVSSAPS